MSLLKQNERAGNSSSSETLRVSVIIPNYNYGNYLPQAIDSVLAQTLPAAEIIVVDDGSTDNTREVLAQYGERIQVIYQQNRGVSVARNHGVENSTGDLLAFLDADDLWMPQKLELQVKRLIENPALGLVHCGVQDIDSEGALLDEHLDGMEGWVASAMLLFSGPVILGGGSASLVTREAFTEAKGFDTRMSTSADWDFYYRIARRRMVGFVPEVLVGYRLHRSNMHGNIRAMEHDVLLAYDKAFAEEGEDYESLKDLRQRAYSNMHMVLASSYFQAKQPRRFLRHALKSLWLNPGKCSYLLGFPMRRLQRRKQQRAVSAAAIESRTSRGQP